MRDGVLRMVFMVLNMSAEGESKQGHRKRDCVLDGAAAQHADTGILRHSANTDFIRNLPCGIHALRVQLMSWKPTFDPSIHLIHLVN